MTFDDNIYIQWKRSHGTNGLWIFRHERRPRMRDWLYVSIASSGLALVLNVDELWTGQFRFE